MSVYHGIPQITVTYHEPLDLKMEVVDIIESVSPIQAIEENVLSQDTTNIEFHKADIIESDVIIKRSSRFRWRVPISFNKRSKSVSTSEVIATKSKSPKDMKKVQNNNKTISGIDSKKLLNEMMAQTDNLTKSVKEQESRSKVNALDSTCSDKKMSLVTNDGQQKLKGGIFKNFGKLKIKSDNSNSSNPATNKMSQKSPPLASAAICSGCPPPKPSRFTVETCNQQLFPIYQRRELLATQCNHSDPLATVDSIKSKKYSKAVTMISDKTMKLINLENFRFRSNSGTYHSGAFKLPDPTKLPEDEPFSSLTFCRTPLKSADDDRYWVTDNSSEKGRFKKLSKSSISKSEQNLVYNEPSRRIEDALSQSKLSNATDVPNATIQVAYRHGVNRVTENDQIIMLSKTSTRDRSTYLSEGVHRLDEAETFYAFFQHSTCYDIMPDNSKLVVLDSRLQVGKAFRALIFNGVRAALIWQFETQQYVGILTITDFINILNLYEHQNPNSRVDIESEAIDKWREITGIIKKPLFYVRPESSLFIALKELRNHRVHRLPVIDMRSGNVLHIITHKRLMKYLYIKQSKIPQADFLKRTIEDVNVGTFDPVFTVTLNTTVGEVLNIFDTNNISAVPVVDPVTRKLVDLYAKFDCIYLASTGNYKDLNLTIADALQFRSQTSFHVQTCKKTDTLSYVMEKIVTEEVHRLVVINNETERLVIGIVSLADLLHYFVLRLSGRHSSGNVLNGTPCCSNLGAVSGLDDSVDQIIRSDSVENVSHCDSDNDRK